MGLWDKDLTQTKSEFHRVGAATETGIVLTFGSTLGGWNKKYN